MDPESAGCVEGLPCSADPPCLVGAWVGVWGEGKALGTWKAGWQAKGHQKECWNAPQRERAGICCRARDGEGQGGRDHVVSANRTEQHRTRVDHDWAPRGEGAGDHGEGVHGVPSLPDCDEEALDPPGLRDEGEKDRGPGMVAPVEAKAWVPPSHQDLGDLGATWGLDQGRAREAHGDLVKGLPHHPSSPAFCCVDYQTEADRMTTGNNPPVICSWACDKSAETASPADYGCD